MPIEDLDLILKKDPIITTFPVSQLQTQPQMVEQSYIAHARTHLSLGETERHVDTIFRWVSGQNQGAFIGAVEGNYGEGKTSFLVHVWAESQARRIFTVPPFEWVSLADGVTAVGAWLAYILGREQPAVARKAEQLYEQYKQESLEDVARETASQTEGDYETVLAALKNREARGARLTETTPERFLSFLAEASGLVKTAGYQGLLVVLDEPEVAAKKIGKENVAHLLFDLANLLREAQGEYGVLVSMPSNFLADVTRRFPALTARLQARNCFPRLRDIYGPDFARDLWSRYVAEFGLGEEGGRIVSDLALQAIGQVGSSDRSDLSYGPRTVVSAFSRMVYQHRATGKTYEPEYFVRDCLMQEVMAQPEYRTRVQELLRSPEVTEACREAVVLLAAFPNGLKIEAAQERGVDVLLRDLARKGTLVYKTAATFGLNGLRKEGTVQVDPLRDAILEIESEFAPSQVTFGHAAAAFKDRVIPLVFEQRKGHQLVDWEMVSPWARTRSGTWVGGFVGAFLQTQKHFPKRAVLVIISALDAAVDDIDVPSLPVDSGPQEFDAVFHFRLRWHTNQELPETRLEVRPGDPAGRKFGLVRITIDLLQACSAPPALAEVVEAGSLNPLWLLNLIHHLDKEELPRDSSAMWQAMRTTMLRDLLPLFFSEDLGATAVEQIGQPVSGSGLSLLGSLLQKILAARYPTYSTLICSPRWEERVADYVQVLKNPDVPLACKRGREKWKAEGDTASRAFGTSRMNLSTAFEGLENLVVISSAGRTAPLEVEFRVHPLEKTVAELICSDRCGPDKKLKIEDKECWWIPVADLMPIIKASGYTIEELKSIVDIGSARGTFSVTTHDREQIVYCKPIDPEQMRRQLQEKLEDLVGEIAQFRTVPQFHTDLDAEAIGRKIAAVQEEVEYERLATRLNKEFVVLHERLPGYFDRLSETLRTTRSDVQHAAGQLAGSREVTLLATIPSAKSAWVASLSKHIVGNLKPETEQLRAESAALIRELDGYTALYRYQGQIPPADNIAPLVEGHAKVADAQAKAKQFLDRTRDLMGNLKEYEEWLNLLRRSDQVYEDLLQLRTKGLEGAATGNLLDEYERFSREVAEHLEALRVSGISAHRQFAATLDDIERKRLAYLGRIKGEFDGRKEAVNRLLEALKLDRRVTVTFNPTSGDACYAEMFEQGAAHLREAAVARPLTEIEGQERELLYARDVLGSVEGEQAKPLIEGLAASRANLKEMESQTTAEWIRQVTEEDAEDARAELAQVVEEALGAVRETRKLVREATRVTKPTEGRAKAMYELVAQADGMDLKEIILRMMEGGGSASHVLDESLASLIELFRSNCVQLRVSRRRE